jgi:GNAT superfamily N-acetyltransferase/DNA-binding HxlR family transcriptional regulator
MLDAIARLRRFNRVVTREISALDTSYLGLGRPLGAARVLQLVRPEGTDVAELRARLGLDTGLLSRLLGGLKREGLLRLTADPADRRRRIASLTNAGNAEWQRYDRLGHAKAQATFQAAGARQRALVDAMDLIATLLLRDKVEMRDADANAPEALACLAAYYRLLADKIPGVTPEMLTLPLSDGYAYNAPHGAFIVAWSDDLPVGCVSLRPLTDGAAEVKRLWIDPDARGQGHGRRLMAEIESRARALGYSRLQLDSNAVLTEATTLYKATGWGEIAPYTGFPANVWLGKPL